jgi:hypothetical protein
MCCRTDLEECTKGYKYCTTNLKQDIYKVITCPIMDTCPKGQVVVAHDTYDTIIEIERRWSYFERASFCKLVFTRKDESINGKITIEVEHAENVNIYIYLQPNNFNNSKYGT